MKPELKYLSDNDIKLVHEKALEMLEDMGIKFEGIEAREYFEKAGAIIEEDIVKIPRKIIEDTLKTVPKREDFILYGRTPNRDVRISDEIPSIAAMTMATNVIDPYTGNRRPATDKDLEMLTRVLETLDTVTMASGLITPQDVPMEASDWYTWATTIKNTTKHITGGAVGKEGVRDAIKMASLAIGSEEEFLKRPFIFFDFSIEFLAISSIFSLTSLANNSLSFSCSNISFTFSNATSLMPFAPLACHDSQLPLSVISGIHISFLKFLTVFLLPKKFPP